jgi:hypothetical protein
MKPSVVALPGGVNPAGLRYAPVLSALGGEVDLHLKDLEACGGKSQRGPHPRGRSVILT